jgi:hypothetical protein
MSENGGLNSGNDDQPEANGSLSSPITAAAVALALSVAGWMAVDATAGLLRIVFAVVTLVALVCALYLAAILVFWFTLSRTIDSIGRPRPESVLTRLPGFVWMTIPVLIGGWALQAWLWGFDATQWLWTGVSVAAAAGIVAAAYFRRRRWASPDSPDGPRHRRRSSS